MRTRLEVQRPYARATVKRMHCRSFTLIALSVFTLGCPSPEVIDQGSACVSTYELDGQQRLLVEANSGDCASDHKGASFECTITSDGMTAHIETVFQDGKDPNAACPGPLETSCEIDVEPGTYTLEFAGEQRMIVVPDGEQTCFSSALGETEGP
jgi:hypothetical protein